MLREAIAALFALPLAASAQSSFPPDSTILPILKQRVAEKRSAGIVVGLLDPDGRTRIISYGDAGPGKLPLDSNSVFEIGSITKVFTATVLAQLVLEGKVTLDDPVQKFLPASVHMPTRNGMAITLGNLSEQNSGLPRMPSNMHPADPLDPFADYSVAQMYDFLSSYTLTRDPGAEFEYSNLGVGLLGHVLALITGMPYEQMIRQRVLVPLGMHNTGIALTPWMQQHLALGHNEAGDVTKNWNIGTLAGAGAIRSTTADMLRFAEANLHPERGPVNAAMAFAQKPRIRIPIGMIGLNWITQPAGTDTITWHNGGTGGYRTFLGLDRGHRRAVVVMTNSGGEGADDIGGHLLVPALPLAPKPAAMKERTAIELPAAKLASYVGTYQLAPTFAIEITLDGNALYLQATGQGKIRLWPETERDFFIREVDAQVTFEASPSGDIAILVLHQNGRDLRGAKVK